MIKCASLFSQILNEISSSRFAVLTTELNNINTAANMTAPRVLCSGRFKHLIQAVPLPALITGS